MDAAKALKTVIDTSDRLQKSGKRSATDRVHDLAANELVFAVVGPVGSGPTKIAEQLEIQLQTQGFQTSILKAADAIGDWAEQNGLMPKIAPEDLWITTPEGKRKRRLAPTRELQNLGDKFRETSGDNGAVARELIKMVRLQRARQMNVDPHAVKSIEPDGKPRAFILDSVRHPDEVALLRRVYQDAFWLVGVFCHEKQREDRLSEKYEAGKVELGEFIKRDQNAPEDYGQRVADAFHLADYFVDNTPDEKKEEKKNPKWDVGEQIGRLIDILLHKRMARPRGHETGMFHAYGARMKSSCLSRQVGAALVGQNGDVIATGTNEVPRAGGGTLTEGILEGDEDHRCFAQNWYCSNVREQNDIIRDLFREIPAFKNDQIDDKLLAEIRRTRIGQLVEFSRAVHAEMDALLSAARSAVSTVGARLYVTTFPCHSCARHIIAAGVVEVQYIEPYFQSRAFRLHKDSITDNPDITGILGAPKKVLFRPFIGVAPRLYRRAFYKDQRLKDRVSGDMLEVSGSPDGPASSEVLKVSYAQVESYLTERDTEATAKGEAHDAER